VSENGQKQGSLPSILHRAEKINDAQLNTLQTRAAGMSDKELGLLLINSGYVSQQDILESLQGYFVALIQQLFTWVEGRFKFDPAQDVPDSKIPVRISLEDLIMEGSRQVREELMVEFIKDPSDKVHNSLGRRMPRLGVTDEEARAIVAFLKWMSTIDTNGFPYNFKPLDQEG